MIRPKKAKHGMKAAPRLHGEVVLFQTPIYNWITLFVCAIVITSLVYLAIGKYAKKANVSGVIASNLGVARILAKSPGSLEKQFFKVGDVVKKGDVLLSISTRRQSLSSEDHDTSILKELEESIKNLEDKVVNIKRLSEIQDVSLVTEIAGKGREIKALIQQKKLLAKNVSASREMLEGLHKLKSSGVVSTDKYNEFRERDIGLQLKAEDINLRIESARSEIDLLSNERAEQPIKVKVQENELRQMISEIAQRRVDVLANQDYTVVSPIDGVVATTLANVGEAVTAHQSLLTILPVNFEFQAELYLPSHAIGFVKEQQDVYMRYSAFPYQHFGLQKGRIIEVSSVISQPEELQQGDVLRDPVYKVIVKLDSQTVGAAGDQLPIHVGMTLEASIKLESRSVWQWVMEPIYSLKGRS